MKSVVPEVREFNRFYTRQIGILSQHLLGTQFSLTESRVLFELAQSATVAARDVARNLGMDAAYLSRILRSFEKQGLLNRKPSELDGRQQVIELTTSGHEQFRRLSDLADQQVKELLEPLDPNRRAEVVAAMRSIRRLLGDKVPPAACLIREHRSGDLGYIVHRHGALYSQEYGWDASFEALVARIAADFIDNFDPLKERCWVAELEGRFAGSVMLVKYPQEENTAKLRLLLVEPAARGMGLGRSLVAECIRFAHQSGYKKITLWTDEILTAARNIYRQSGFRMVHSERRPAFGHDMVSETWELEL